MIRITTPILFICGLRNIIGNSSARYFPRHKHQKINLKRNFYTYHNVKIIRSCTNWLSMTEGLFWRLSPTISLYNIKSLLSSFLRILHNLLQRNHMMFGSSCISTTKVISNNLKKPSVITRNYLWPFTFQFICDVTFRDKIASTNKTAIKEWQFCWLNNKILSFLVLFFWFRWFTLSYFWLALLFAEIIYSQWHLHLIKNKKKYI